MLHLYHALTQSPKSPVHSPNAQRRTARPRLDAGPSKNVKLERGPEGGPGEMGLVSLQAEETGHRHPEGQPCEDTGGRGTSASRGERPPEEPTLLACRLPGQDQTLSAC